MASLVNLSITINSCFEKAKKGKKKKIFFENEFQYKNQGKSNLDISGFFEDHCGGKGFIFCFVLKNLINDMI